ncbi:hypothetical protein DNL40_03285 [Xylanimonas oleitrophica]|uniref:Uncharacterized protein n=1 Tax=Xylanimonas oleitrophica TaxID=2607479 RepID=A0A2W5XXE3_9MICO|nr:hypothetical protein [Xylanimonas oleitrophica]PZR55398.1 hypothetical protein DNL40_03285 [Xylanimonas oleitrophica]
MGDGAAIVTDYFAAPSDDAAALALDVPSGPSTLARGSGEPLFDTVALPGVEPFVMLGTLHELLSGRPYGECTAEGRHGQVVGGDGEGPWVVSLSDGLVEALVRSSPTRLADVAARWARTPEVRQVVPLVASTAVLALAELAHRATDVRHSLYCWTRLPD